MDLVTYLLLFIGLLLLGSPIYISLPFPSILYFITNPDMQMLVIPQKMLASMDSFPLMAIPFFVLAGQMMNEGGVTDRIFGFAKSVVGHFRGGLGYVNIVASVIFSGMSGSSLATRRPEGQVELKAMRDSGYDDDFSVGLTGASATVGPIIPPSVPAIIVAGFSGISVGALFLGGIIPGLLMAGALGVMCYVISKKRNYPREPRTGFKGILISFWKTLLSLFMPVIIIGGIWSGWFTATEAALVSIVYTLIISIVVYRDLNLKKLPKLLLSTKTISPILSIIVGATLFAWILNYEKLDQKLLGLLTSITQNKYIILLLINFVVLILGMFFDAIVAQFMVVPLSIPICTAYGISPLHIGVVFIVNNMIGMSTPPVGMSLYTLAAVAEKPIATVGKWILPWMIPLFVTLILITYIDWLVLAIPVVAGFSTGK